MFSFDRVKFHVIERQRRRFVATGYQWVCAGCEDGATGGFEQNQPRIEREAIAHAKETGHKVYVDQWRRKEV